MIYLDNNATTRPDFAVMIEASNETYESFGNPSSWHEPGYDAKDLLETARCSVAQSLNAKPSEIIFTSGGTEANNLALSYNKKYVGFAGSEIEHSSVDKILTKKFKVLPEGFVDLVEVEDFVKKHKNPRSLVISVMLANNETGVVLDPDGALAHWKDKYGFVLHIDAVQGLGKFKIDVGNLNVDLLTVSAHKVYGPKGVGALYIRKESGNKPNPIFAGGAHEWGFRPGTENIFGIVAFGKVCDKYCDELLTDSTVRDYFESELVDIARVNGSEQHRVYNTSNLFFPAIKDLDAFLERLSMNGVAASGKSACSSGMPAPSRVITKMYNKERAEASVRFSFAHNSTKEEAAKAVVIIKEIMNEVENG